jgi:hypothetical protein
MLLALKVFGKTRAAWHEPGTPPTRHVGSPGQRDDGRVVPCDALALPRDPRRSVALVLPVQVRTAAVPRDSVVPSLHAGAERWAGECAPAHAAALLRSPSRGQGHGPAQSAIVVHVIPCTSASAGDGLKSFGGEASHWTAAAAPRGSAHDDPGRRGVGDPDGAAADGHRSVRTTPRSGAGQPLSLRAHKAASDLKSPQASVGPPSGGVG